MNTLNKKTKSTARRKDLIFYIAFMAYPVAQFLLMYVAVNINSILLAFKSYDVISNTTTVVWFDNLKTMFVQMTSGEEFIGYLNNTVKFYLLQLVLGTSLGLLFSYYIYKKGPATNFFKIVLFMPSILSTIVLSTVFNFFVERAVPNIVNTFFDGAMKGLLETQSTRFATLVFFNILISFGMSVLMYSNAMGNIDPSIIEAGKVDGAVGIKEFIYIVFPCVFSTFSTFFITGLGAIFTNQFNVFNFYGNIAPDNVSTYGYWFYNKVQMAKSQAEYPKLASAGILLTCVTLPIVMLARYLLIKFGPSED